MSATIDHLVYATPDVEATADEIARSAGVRPSLGGRHEGAGTFNMLATLARPGLDTSTYLEVIGPDPDQPAPSRPRPFAVDDLSAPRLVGWAISTTDIDASIASAREHGYDPGDAAAMTRRRPDDVVLAWRLTLNGATGSLVPFLIDWGDTEHPSRTSPTGLRLVSFRIEHPRPPAIEAALAALDVDVAVSIADDPALIATIAGPAGQLELR